MKNEKLNGRISEGSCLAVVANLTFWVVIIVFALICAFGFSSCKTKYIEVPVVHVDTLLLSSNIRDSIYLHDSIYVKEWQKGDTVFLQSTKWLTKYVEKQVHDTCYRSRTDTIGVPYPVETLVEKQLTWWQKTKMKMGIVFMGIVGVMGIVGAMKLKRKFF